MRRLVMPMLVVCVLALLGSFALAADATCPPAQGTSATITQGAAYESSSTTVTATPSPGMTITKESAASTDLDHHMMTPGTSMAPGSAMTNGRPMTQPVAAYPPLSGAAAITVAGDDVFVVSGGMLLKFDRDLKLLRQSALPAPSTSSTAYYGYPMYAPSAYVTPGTTPMTGYGMPLYGPPMSQRWQWSTVLGSNAVRSGSSATGRAFFSLNPNGQSIDYTLDVSNLNDPTEAHIHVVDSNGRIGEDIAPLYTGGRIPGSFTGELVHGMITADELMGPFKGQPLSALIDAFNAGRIAVVVHSERFPNGEIGGTALLMPMR